MVKGKYLYYLSIIITTAMIAMFGSCKRDYLKPLEVELPDTVSFVNDILPIFNDNCSTSGCHMSGGVAPNLGIDVAYNNMFLYILVDTINPELSIMYTRMNSSSNPMPPDGKLSQNKIDLILKWIQLGALNN